MPKAFLVRRFGNSQEKSAVKKNAKQLLHPTRKYQDGNYRYDHENLNHDNPLPHNKNNKDISKVDINRLYNDVSLQKYEMNNKDVTRFSKENSQIKKDCNNNYSDKYPLAFIPFPDKIGLSKTECLASPQKPFSCSVCGKSFRLSSTLCRHKIIHTSERPHKCGICCKSFNRSSTLKTHLRTHNQSKEFACRTCGKGFHQKGNLRNHILIHTGEKPYTCKVCKKSFNKLSNLKFHMHIHTDQKPYRCRFCKLAMGRRGELKSHISTFHPRGA